MLEMQAHALGGLRGKYYRAMFLLAALWNGIAAVAALGPLSDASFRAKHGIAGNPDTMGLQLLAVCLAALGWGYYRVSRDLTATRDLVWIGALGKPFVFAIFLRHALIAAIPLWLGALSVVDLVFGILFVEFLVNVRRIAGQPEETVSPQDVDVMAVRTDTESLVKLLSAESYRSIPRVCLDILLWVGAAVLALYVDRWWFTAICIFAIGFGPFHDLLVQGHEGTHDLISRNRIVNDLFAWFALALAGISAEAHRRFHLDHHHYAHSEKDPEYQYFNRVVCGVPGWTYLLIPAFAQFAVNSYGMRRTTPAKSRVRILLELLAGALLHAGLAYGLGWRWYLLFVLSPMLTGLYVASVLRGVTEHHDVRPGSEWTNARSIVTNRFVEFLWSNVNYHLEHHLYPSVPYHALPALRRSLADQCHSRGSHLDRGYGRTALALLRDPRHFAPSEEQRGG